MITQHKACLFVLLIIISVSSIVDGCSSSSSKRNVYVKEGKTAKLSWGGKHIDKLENAEWFYVSMFERSMQLIGYKDKNRRQGFIINETTCPESLLKPNVRVKILPSNGTLLITNVKMKDSGIYGNKVESSVQDPLLRLVVTDTPRFKTFPKAAITVFENDDATLLCSAVGRPKPRITWLSRHEESNRTALHKEYDDTDNSSLLSAPPVTLYPSMATVYHGDGFSTLYLRNITSVKSEW